MSFWAPARINNIYEHIKSRLVVYTYISLKGPKVY